MTPGIFSKGDKMSLKLHHLTQFKYQGPQLLDPLLILCKKAPLYCHLDPPSSTYGPTFTNTSNGTPKTRTKVLPSAIQ